MPVSKSRKKKPPRRPQAPASPALRSSLANAARPVREQMWCPGYQLDHRDGSMSCTRGKDCSGIAGAHAGWHGCDVYAPCAHCDGPPVVWIH